MEISKQTFFELSKVLLLRSRPRQMIDQLLLNFEGEDKVTSIEMRKVIEGYFIFLLLLDSSIVKI
jgi:hypothetical protein